MGCVVDHPWFPVPRTLQDAVHNAESLQSSRPPAGTTPPAGRSLTGGPSTDSLQTAAPALETIPGIGPVRDPGSRQCPSRLLRRSCSLLGVCIGSQGTRRTANDDVPGTGPASGLVAVEPNPPMAPRHNTRAGFWLVVETTIARGPLPHAGPNRKPRNRNGPAWQPATFSGARVGYTACIDSATEVLHQPSTVPLVRASPD